MKVYHFLICFFLFFGNSVIVAQEKFEPAYVVDLKMDTIKGFIKEETDAQLAKRISFKKNLEASAKEYTANELLGFGFDSGRIFKRHRIYAAGNERYIFAKRILKGKTDLFVWRKKGKAKPDFFVTNTQINKTVHLNAPSKKEITSEEGKKYSVKNKQYLELLNQIKTDLKDQEQKEIRYNENKIYKDLRNYNIQFSEKYPVSDYEESQVNSYEVTFGMMPKDLAGETHFRVAVYRDKLRVERSTNWSYIRGFSYRYWENDNEKNRERFSTGTSSYRWQSLSLIPIGIKYQSNKGIFRPYSYVGLGVGFLLRTDHVVENYEITGVTKSFFPFPTIHVGAGIKAKLGKDFLLFEVTPSFDGVFLNIGYSF